VQARVFFAPSVGQQPVDFSQMRYSPGYVASALPQQPVVQYVQAPPPAAPYGGATAAAVAIVGAALGVMASRAILVVGSKGRPLARSMGRGNPNSSKGGLETVEEQEARYVEWRSSMGVTVDPLAKGVKEAVEEDVEYESALGGIKVTVSTKHFEITPAVQEHVDAKLQHVAERFGDHLFAIDAHLEVLRNPSAKGEKHSAELVAEVKGGWTVRKSQTVRVKATGHDMYLAINESTKQLERKVRQLKEKATGKMRHGKESDRENSTLEYSSTLPGYEGTDDIDEAVLAAKSSTPMSMEEAMENFNLAEDDGATDAFVFIDKATEKVSVLYRDEERKINLFLPKENKLTVLA
jgi:ribosomal subunit interface protein